MQMTYISVWSCAITALIAFLGAIFLFRIWHNQENRLPTDLPLLFSLSFLGTAANMTIYVLPSILIIEPSLTLFKIRSLAVGLATIPMAGMVLNIWLPNYARWHIRSMILIVFYWITVLLFVQSEPLIIVLTVPILLMFALALVVTFAITWKTHRLREVRSELIVIGLLIAVVFQALKVPLLVAGLEYVGFMMTTVMIFLVTLGLLNPWHRE